MKIFFKKLRIFFRLKREKFISWFKENHRSIIVLICILSVWSLLFYFLPIEEIVPRILLSFFIMLGVIGCLEATIIFPKKLVKYIISNMKEVEIELLKEESKGRKIVARSINDLPTIKNKTRFNGVLRD